MNYKVEVYNKHDNTPIPDEIQDEYEYILNDCNSVLAVYYDNRLIRSEILVENEDLRNFEWIKTALLEAYSWGKKDA